VTCHTQPCKPCKVKYVLDYLPQGDESSPRGGWGICAPALPEVLTGSSLTKYLDASLHRTESSWTKVKKALRVWQNEKGIHHSAAHPLKGDKAAMSSSQKKPFGTAFHHYQSVRYVKLCHAVGVVEVGKLDKVYQSRRVHLFLRNVLTFV
jgi:hypothetical protein